MSGYRWNPSFSRVRHCGSWSCWIDRVLFVQSWGGMCAIRHQPVGDPGGVW